jgi:hypothetical protein
LAEIIEKARGKVIPKRYSIEQIRKEDREHREHQKSERDKIELQRKEFSKKFNRIQEFIDSQQRY